MFAESGVTRSVRGGFAVALAAVFVLVAAPAAPAQSEPPFPNGPIEVTNLTNTPSLDAQEFTPSWSPDGEWIAYMRLSRSTDSRTIWVMRSDGTDQHQVSSPPGFLADQYPDFSPDGSEIAFTRFDDGTSSADVWVVDAEGTTEEQLTTAAAGRQYREPAWSPDGTELAVASNVLSPPPGEDRRFDLLTIDRGTGAVSTAYQGPDDKFGPEWSPDGTALFFYSFETGISSVPVPGGTPTSLIEEAGGVVADPSVSPDGSHLAYEFYGDDNDSDVFVADSDGTDRVDVTPFAVTREFQPDFAPDGNRLTYSGFVALSPDDGGRDIFCVGAPGTCPGPKTATTQDAAAGDTVSTNTATSTDDPVGASVTTPNAGTVTINEGGTTGYNPTGYSLLDQQVNITAPDGTAADPLVLTFRFDSSVLPTGTDAATLAVFRNGSLVEECDPGAGGNADPDPCVAGRAMEVDGDAVITVRTSAASAWNFGAPSDSAAPEITLTTPAEGASYLLGQQVAADYSCEDEEGGSGLASCTGSVPDAQPIDTASVGAKSFTVEAADNAGNTASVTHSYSVVYDFAGFFAPVNNPPALNKFKPGETVAVRFSLHGNRGLGILAAGFPASHRIDCLTGARIGSDEPTAPAGATGLAYQASKDRYTYSWQTAKGWLNTCRQFSLGLRDGSEHFANFSFRR